MVFQMENQESGAASLAMVLGFYRCYVSLEDCRINCGGYGDGCTPVNLVKAGAKYGLIGEQLTLTATELTMQNITLPAIMVFFPNKYVVATCIRNNSITFNDPAEGERKIDQKELNAVFTGQVIRLTPGADFRTAGTAPSFIRSIMRRMNGCRTALFFVLIVGVLLVLPGLAAPAMTKIFFDQVLGQNLTQWLAPLLAFMFLIGAMKEILCWLQGHYLSRIESFMLMTFGSETFNRMFRLPMVFFQQRAPGEILSRFNLINPVVVLLAGRIGFNLVNLVTVLFFIGLMFQFDFILTMICLVAIAINIAAIRMANHIQNKLNRQSITAKNNFTGTLSSGIQMIESIKAVDMELEYYSMLAGQHAEMINSAMHRSMVSAYIYAVPPLLNTLTAGVILVHGSFRILDGSMSIGMLIAFQLLAAALLDPINQLVNLGGQLQESRAGLIQLDDMVDSREDERFLCCPEKFDPGKHQPTLTGSLEFRNVTFGYSRLEPPLLKEFNFKLEPGRRVAIVGRSGSGKSTVALLASGLYRPWSGEILYDGKPRSQIPVEVMNNSLAIVNQNIYLFRDTIRENLTMWDRSIPEKEIFEAASDAYIHNEITVKPNAYSCVLEDNGGNFSGGQRQRLEIARALARNPSILVMDEATSALDPQTEKIIDDNIRRRGCSCLIVAHRLSTIRDSDEILVMEHGQIVERGSHDALVARQDKYFNMVSAK